LLSTCGLTTSNTESRKLIEQGAVSIENTKITNNNQEISVTETEQTVQAGKRNFAKFKI